PVPPSVTLFVIRRRPGSPLLPYTTLFRSGRTDARGSGGAHRPILRDGARVVRRGAVGATHADLQPDRRPPPAHPADQDQQRPRDARRPSTPPAHPARTPAGRRRETRAAPRGDRASRVPRTPGWAW